MLKTKGDLGQEWVTVPLPDASFYEQFSLEHLQFVPLKRFLLTSALDELKALQ